jgi:hypothetical protein
VIDELEASDYPCLVDAHQDVDRFPGIADGTREIGVQIGIAEEYVAAIDGNDRWVPAYVSVAVGAREELTGLGLSQEFGQPAGGGSLQGSRKDEQEGEDGDTRLGAGVRKSGIVQSVMQNRNPELALQDDGTIK